jgi:chloramphenicol-sensitive protein RarD
MATSDAHDTKAGFLFAGGAYFIWGFLPLFMKMLSHIPAWEVVPHRILWSVPIAGAVVLWSGQWRDVMRAISNPRMLGMAIVTSVIIAINWGIYVWAIGAGRALETALGYYINPLFSVLVAAVLLGEKLNRLQIFAIALAAAAVALLTWEAGGLPIVSVALTVTWGFYAYCKRTLPIGASQGFFLEVLLLSIPAILMWFWFEQQGTSHFLRTGWTDTLLLAVTGLFTAVPLMLYAHGAKGLRLSTIAIMQYSAPTLIFLIAIFVFREPFSSVKLAAFVLIWAALIIYTWALIRRRPA